MSRLSRVELFDRSRVNEARFRDQVWRLQLRIVTWLIAGMAVVFGPICLLLLASIGLLIFGITHFQGFGAIALVIGGALTAWAGLELLSLLLFRTVPPAGVPLCLAKFPKLSTVLNHDAMILSRMEEYRADRWAARLVDDVTIGAALTRLLIVDTLLQEEFYPALQRQTKDTPDAPMNYLTLSRDSLASSLRDPCAAQWIRWGIRRPQGAFDTHPSLRDRLKNLGVEMEVALALADEPAISAAADWFGDQRAELTEQVDSEWAANNRHNWRAEYLRRQSLAQRLPRFPEQPTDAERLEQVLMIEDLEGPAIAFPRVRALHQESPQNMALALHFVRIGCVIGDASAEELGLRMLHESEPLVALQIGHVLEAAYNSRGPEEMLRKVLVRLDELEHAVESRRRVVHTKDFCAPQLDAVHWQPLLKFIGEESEPFDLYFALKNDGARKELTADTYVICVVSQATRSKRQASNQRIVKQLARTLQLPGPTLICSPTGPLESLAKRLCKQKQFLVANPSDIGPTFPRTQTMGS